MLLTLIIAFVVAEFILTSCVDWDNWKYLRLPIPEQLKGIYDDSQYEKQQAYSIEKKKIGLLDKVLSLILLLVLLAFGVIGRFNDWCLSVGGNEYMSLFLFVVIGLSIVTVLSLPFDWYSTFVIEEKYGFNKTTTKTFVGDAIKQYLLSVVLINLLLGVILLLYNWLGGLFWIYGLIFVGAISIFFSMFYSTLIVPLFNKQTPLPEGELRDAIMDLADNVGFSIKNIYVINGSKHSTKANAYFTGLGRTKRVVLYDTLIDQLTTGEIVAVLAHEFGHCKHNDIYRSLAIGLVYLGINFFIFSLIVEYPELSYALGAKEKSFILALVAFGLLFTPIEMIINPISNWFSRHAEYKADSFANSLGYGAELISGLKKLTTNSLSPLQYSKWFIRFNLSHPILLQRIKNITK